MEAPHSGAAENAPETAENTPVPAGNAPVPAGNTPVPAGNTAPSAGNVPVAADGAALGAVSGHAPVNSVSLTVNSPVEMGELGRSLAKLLRPGDLVMLTGELGAGKTTLTRGLGEGLGVRGAVTSPTFVIARVHPPLGGGPALVHVDAYRLGGGLDEMEDLDLDVSLPDSVIVVEWGDGKVEELSEDRLRVVIDRATGDTDDDVRKVRLDGIGSRWAGEALGALEGSGALGATKDPEAAEGLGG